MPNFFCVTQEENKANNVVIQVVKVRVSAENWVAHKQK